MNTAEVLSQIEGDSIEYDLTRLASLNGRPYEPIDEQSERYASNRLALYPEDKLARNEFITPLMKEAGMLIDDSHPLGLIGIFEGADPDLAPLVILSHIDTVPEGDMYDGTLGVLSGIEIIRAMREAGFKPDRNIMVISLTGEESAGYNTALFGSRSLFNGLSDEDLDSRRDTKSPSIREMLNDNEIENVKKPVFGLDRKYPLPHAVVELHVEQDSSLHKEGIDLGIVKAIAAPVRFSVTIKDDQTGFNESNVVSAADYPYSENIELIVDGNADHSGATPMGYENRADGLIETAECLLPLLTELYADGDSSGKLFVQDILIAAQAMNKVPGQTKTTLQLRAPTDAELKYLEKYLAQRVHERNLVIHLEKPKFDNNPISIKKSEKGYHASKGHLGSTLPCHISALYLAKTVEKIARSYANQGVVGTATRYRTEEGAVGIDLDIRGIDKASRARVIDKVKKIPDTLKMALGVVASIDFGKPLPGSGDPVAMDDRLVHILEEEITNHEIGSSKIMVSAAGHDAQNAARAGIPSVMLFVESLADGKAHHPDAYTSPESIEKGARALAAFAMRLSTRNSLS